MMDEPQVDETAQSAWAEKINKLLRKAESTPYEAERDSLIAKAQNLMTQWAIDEEMLARSRPEEKMEQILEKIIVYTGSYQQSLWHIGKAAANANSCKILLSENVRTWSTDPKAPKRKTYLYVIGHESDVSKSIMLDQSLQVQATSALAAWIKSEDSRWEYLSTKKRYEAKRGFYVGFADGVASILYAARREAEGVAAQERFDAGLASGSVEDETETVALAMRSRSDRVQDWIDAKYAGKLRSSRTSSFGMGNWDATGAGRSAGKRADVGQPRVGGSRRALT